MMDPIMMLNDVEYGLKCYASEMRRDPARHHDLAAKLDAIDDIVTWIQDHIGDEDAEQWLCVFMSKDQNRTDVMFDMIFWRRNQLEAESERLSDFAGVHDGPCDCCGPPAWTKLIDSENSNDA